MIGIQTMIGVRDANKGEYRDQEQSPHVEWNLRLAAT